MYDAATDIHVAKCLRRQRRLVRQLLLAAWHSPDNRSKVGVMMAAGVPCATDVGWFMWLQNKYPNFPIELASLDRRVTMEREVDWLCRGQLDRSVAWRCYREEFGSYPITGRYVGMVFGRHGSGLGDLVLHNAPFAVDPASSHVRLPEQSYLQPWRSFKVKAAPLLAAQLN